MKTFYIASIAAVFACFCAATVVLAVDINGIWTKTTDPDPNNVTIFYNEKRVIKAIGYSEIQGIRNVWFAEGEIEGKLLKCFYHYGQDTAPAGWELDGTMELTLSNDGNRISGTAKSASGNWSGPIEFKRIQLVPSSAN